jgi:hypothetical protein
MVGWNIRRIRYIRSLKTYIGIFKSLAVVMYGVGGRRRANDARRQSIILYVIP